MLSELDIVVPLQLLIGMFSDGVNSLKELANQRKARATDLTGNTGARRVRTTAVPQNTLSNCQMLVWDYVHISTPLSLCFLPFIGMYCMLP